MSCHQLVSQDGQVIGHLCRDDSPVDRVPRRRRKRKWCFGCRKHLLHTLMRTNPPPMSWYGPRVWWECPRCHKDDTLFPGWEYDYGEQ